MPLHESGVGPVRQVALVTIAGIGGRQADAARARRERNIEAPGFLGDAHHRAFPCETTVDKDAEHDAWVHRPVAAGVHIEDVFVHSREPHEPFPGRIDVIYELVRRMHPDAVRVFPAPESDGFSLIGTVRLRWVDARRPSMILE